MINNFNLLDIVTFWDDLNQLRAGIITGFPLHRMNGELIRAVRVVIENTGETYIRAFEQINTFNGFAADQKKEAQ